MDINLLKTILESSISTDGFVLDTAKLQSTSIDTISDQFFPDAKLQLTVDTSENCVQLSSSGDSVSVTGKGVDYPFNGMDVTAVFSMVEDQASLVMTATADSSWAFNDSFPPLEGTIADYMKFEGEPGPTITLRSDKTEDTSAGMYFGGVIDLNAMSKGLSSLLNIPDQPITGSVVICDNGSNFQSIDFNGPDIEGVNLGIANNCEVGFKIGCQLVQSITDKDGTAIPYIGMTTTIPFTAQGVEQDLKVYVQVGDLNSPIRFSIDMNGSINAAVDELKALTAGVGFDGLLPSDFELGNYVTFDDLFFDYSLDKNTVDFISMGVANASEWKIAQIDGTGEELVVKELALRLMVNDPFGTQNATASIEGEVAITDSGVMCIYGKCPNWEIGGYLKKDSVLSVKDIASFFVGENSSVPDILIDVLDFKLSSEEYSLNTSLKDVWSVTDGDSFVFAIDQVVLSIAYTAATGMDAKFSGVLDIADVNVNLEADYTTSDGFKFTGSTGEGQLIPIGTLMQDLANWFGDVTLPQVLQDLTVENLSVSFDTASKDFTFGCGINFPVSSTSTAYLTVSIALTHKEDGSFDNKFSGTLSIGDLLFDVEFDCTNNASALVATYSNSDGNSISINSLVANISEEFADILPEVDIGLEDVIFVWSKNGETSKYLFGIDISAEIGLSDIPLIGKEFPADETIEVNNLKMVISSGQMSSQEVDTINGMINIDWAKLPKSDSESSDATNKEGTDVALDSGATFTADMQFGSKKEILTLNIGGAGQKNDEDQNSETKPSEKDSDAGDTSETEKTGEEKETEKASGNSTEVADQSTQSESKAKWFTLQKSFGPVYFDRIGVSYQDNCLWFLLDGSITVSGLTISLVGMSIGSTLKAFEPKFYLQGMNVDFKRSPVEIGGGFMAVDPLPDGVSFQYDGDAVISMSKLSIAAIGSYAQTSDGQPSMFVFADINATIGGLPIAFIKGIAAGFGFNRTIEIPEFDEVFEFPLMTLLDSGHTATMTDIQQQLEGLKEYAPGKTKEWIKPSAGEYWFAAGVTFSSYELVLSRVLLVTKFGNELEIAVMGLSQVGLPKPEGKIQFAYAELQMEAVWKPADGFFGVSAVLTSNSFVLDKACHLTGGVALFVWYSGENQGQFVFTMGGYHSKFSPPSYYPKIPRLGFNWTVSDCIQISGSAYFAITPAAIMGGGALDVLFHAGPLRAWFTANADLLIAFNPFYFNASIGVSVGASLQMNLLFTTVTLSVELGASLGMWGPPTGAKVHVAWYVISFTISFGADENPQINDPAGWDDFKPLLPELTSICCIQANSGLSKTMDKEDSGGEKIWLVRTADFSFYTQSVIPCSSFVYQSDSGAVTIEDSQNVEPYDVMIRIMDQTNVQSIHGISILKDGKALDISEWSIKPYYQDVPSALWGKPLTDSKGKFIRNPEVPDNDTVPNAPVGLNVVPPAPVLGYSAGEMAFDVFAYDDIVPEGVLPIDQSAPSEGFATTYASDTVEEISGIMDSSEGGAKSCRDSIYNALVQQGLYSGANGALDNLASKAIQLYTDTPLKV